MASKTGMRWCGKCKCASEHRIGKTDENTGGRIVYGLVTFGLSEFFNDTIAECLKCGQKTTI